MISTSMIQRAILRQNGTAASFMKAAPRVLPLKHRTRPNRLFVQSFPIVTPVRWYAAEPEIRGATDGRADVIEQSQSEKAQSENPLEKALEAQNKEIIDLKDRYLRSVADFRNLQDRTKREVQAAKDFAIQKFAKDLMETVDNLERAVRMVPEDKLLAAEKNEDLKDLVSLYKGLEMTEGILMQTLRKHGLERFDPSIEGEKFNPNEHEATFMAPAEGKEDGLVFHTQVKGFRLNGRILRAAQVGVVKN